MVRLVSLSRRLRRCAGAEQWQLARDRPSQGKRRTRLGRLRRANHDDARALRWNDARCP